MQPSKEMQLLRELGEDHACPDAPEAESLGEDFWKSAQVVMPRGKTSVHPRLDSNIVARFRAHGKGHLTRMNAAPRAYVDAHKGR